MREEDKPTWGERFDHWTDKFLDRVFTEGREEKINRVLDFSFRDRKNHEPAQDTSLSKAHDLLQTSHTDRPIIRGGLGSTRAEISATPRANAAR